MERSEVTDVQNRWRRGQQLVAAIDSLENARELLQGAKARGAGVAWSVGADIEDADNPSFYLPTEADGGELTEFLTGYIERLHQRLSQQLAAL